MSSWWWWQDRPVESHEHVRGSFAEEGFAREDAGAETSTSFDAEEGSAKEDTGAETSTSSDGRARQTERDAAASSESSRREKARDYEETLEVLQEQGQELRKAWSDILSQSHGEIQGLQASLETVTAEAEEATTRLAETRRSGDAHYAELCAQLAAAKLSVCELALEVDDVRMRCRLERGKWEEAKPATARDSD